jgi:hypothetical protein
VKEHVEGYAAQILVVGVDLRGILSLSIPKRALRCTRSLFQHASIGRIGPIFSAATVALSISVNAPRQPTERRLFVRLSVFNSRMATKYQSRLRCRRGSAGSELPSLSSRRCMM